MRFTKTLVNRLEYPVKYIMVVEDDMTHQKLWMDKLSTIFKPQGDTIIVMAPTADIAYSIVKDRTERHIYPSLPKILILDHDLQWGNGRELIIGMNSLGVSCPLFLSSGIDENNEKMKDLAELCYWNHRITTLKNKHNDPELTNYIVRELFPL